MEVKTSVRSFKIPAIENEHLHVIKEDEVINLFCGTHYSTNEYKCKSLIWEYLTKNVKAFDCITYYDFQRCTEFKSMSWRTEVDLSYDAKKFIEYNVYINTWVKPIQQLINGNLTGYEKIYWLSIKPFQHD